MDHNLLNEFPFINSAMERAGIKVEAGKALPAKFILRDKLAPFAEDTLRAVLQRFRDGALSKGIRPALVLLEIPSDSPSRPKSFDRLLSIGESINLQFSISKVRSAANSNATRFGSLLGMIIRMLKDIACWQTGFFPFY